MPAWDEIEMRRHGLVNRHCERLCYPDCPSNPSTIDVSIYKPASAMSSDTRTVTFPNPADSMSPSSGFTTPLAASTPRSKGSKQSVYYIDETKSQSSLGALPPKMPDVASSSARVSKTPAHPPAAPIRGISARTGSLFATPPNSVYMDPKLADHDPTKYAYQQSKH